MDSINSTISTAVKVQFGTKPSRLATIRGQCREKSAEQHCHRQELGVQGTETTAERGTVTRAIKANRGTAIQETMALVERGEPVEQGERAVAQVLQADRQVAVDRREVLGRQAAVSSNYL